MSEARPEVEQEVFAGEGEPAFGAVRHVHNDYLVVHVENSGEVSIDAKYVLRVHDGKVIVDVGAMPEELRDRIRHAHDREDR